MRSAVLFLMLLWLLSYAAVKGKASWPMMFMLIGSTAGGIIALAKHLFFFGAYLLALVVSIVLVKYKTINKYDGADIMGCYWAYGVFVLMVFGVATQL